jgi:transposase
MTPEQAQALSFAGQEAVLTSLCELNAQVQASPQEIEALQRKIAQLSKDSSNSRKRPSSDDITKPKKGPKKNHGANEKGNKIGGQPGPPKYTRPPYPPGAISHTQEHESMDCPLCGA